MFDRLFIRRLERELPRWAARGWLAVDGEAAILADLRDRSRGRSAPAFLFGGLGALLVAVGVVLLFAANWPSVPRWAKLGLIFGMVWGSYGAALVVTRAGFRRFAEAFILLGVLLFGAAVMLIGQTYHLPADPPAGVLLWAFGAFLAAYAWPSGLATIVGYALACLWAGLTVVESPPVVFWPFLLVWAIPLPLLLRHGWIAARHVALLAFFFWVLLSFVTMGDFFHPDIDDLLRFGAALGALFVALGALIAADTRYTEAGHVIGHYGLVMFTGMLFVGVAPGLHAQVDLTDGIAAGFAFASAMASGIGAVFAALIHCWTSARIPWLCVGGSGLYLVASLLPAEFEGVTLLALNFATLGVWLGLVALGYRTDDRFAVNLGFMAFAAGLVMIYFTWFWSLFDRSVFFLGGGALVLSIGWLLERQRRRLMKQMEQMEQPA